MSEKIEKVVKIEQKLCYSQKMLYKTLQCGWKKSDLEKICHSFLRFPIRWKSQKREKKNENTMKLIEFGWCDSSSIISSSTWWKKKINNGKNSNEDIKCYIEKEINLNN